jgi:hypothetical protein
LLVGYALLVCLAAVAVPGASLNDVFTTIKAGMPTRGVR